MHTAEQINWQPLCNKADLIANSGVCALVDGQQIAVFYLPKEQPEVFALGNWDPIGKANVMSRGIVGDIGDKIVVASPLYKQHFELATGQCLEEAEVKVPAYAVAVDGEQVLIAI